MADYSMHSDRESAGRDYMPRPVNDAVNYRGEGSCVYNEENDPVAVKANPYQLQEQLFQLIKTLGLETLTEYYTLKAVEAILKEDGLWYE